MKKERDDDEHYEDGEIPGLDLVKKEEPRAGTTNISNTTSVRLDLLKPITRSQGLMAHLIYLYISFAITWDPHPIPDRERILSTL